MLLLARSCPIRSVGKEEDREEGDEIENQYRKKGLRHLSSIERHCLTKLQNCQALRSPLFFGK